MGEGRPDPQGGREEGMLSLEEESFLLREIGLVSRGIGEKLRDSREMIRIFRGYVLVLCRVTELISRWLEEGWERVERGRL